MGTEVMKIIIDDFLDDFESFRGYCDSLTYGGEVNPKDGVFYPGVSLAIPDKIQSEIVEKLERGTGLKITHDTMFLRLSTKYTYAPHQAHTDAIHGDYGFMLYLNRLEDCIGGTSFVRHKETGLSAHPINEKQVKVWEKDHSNPDAWSIYDMCDMKQNRACVFDATLMHRSEPVGGFGDTAKDGRLVLVCFFSVTE